MSFFKALLGICDTKPLADDAWRADKGNAVVNLKAATTLTEKGGAAYLKGRGLARPVLVIRGDDGQLYAYQDRCTHGGRKIDPLPGEGKLKCCSVNHSTFDYDGKPLSGPAKHNIERYDTEERDGELFIKITQEAG
jgi:nitrite reductase/ring-hydroxylating ferredoxin subunit